MLGLVSHAWVLSCRIVSLILWFPNSRFPLRLGPLRSVGPGNAQWKDGKRRPFFHCFVCTSFVGDAAPIRRWVRQWSYSLLCWNRQRISHKGFSQLVYIRHWKRVTSLMPQMTMLSWTSYCFSFRRCCGAHHNRNYVWCHFVFTTIITEITLT